jgi:NADPH:quinone reductase-like Zn-dependent oxidoreductase
MRAVVIHEIGGPAVLRVEDVPTPVAGAGQALVRTEAVGIGFYETLFRAGVYPIPGGTMPAVFGYEAAGTVTEVGPDVDTAWVGRRVVVMDLAGSGAYAEYAAVSADALTPIPDDLSATDAVAVAVSGAVALCLLRKAGLTAGENVLVEAASGGVGGYLTQLARVRGPGRIVATAGSPVKREHARELGADVVLDHTDPDWPDRVRDAVDGAGLDVVFESIGGGAPRRLLDVMTPGDGRVLFYGMLSRQPPEIGPLDLLPRGLTLVACGGLTAWALRVRAARAEALDLAVKGEIRPLIDSVRPLEDVVAAHQRVEDRLAMGKIVLTM